jgi:DNA-binding XRE family transcriptional regulator
MDNSQPAAPCFLQTAEVDTLNQRPSRSFALPRPKSLSRYLRSTRLERGMTIAALAELTGVSAVSIYNWEAGIVRPRDANLTALCKALRLPIRATREMAGA